MQNTSQENSLLLKTGKHCRFYDLEQYLDTPISRFMRVTQFFQLLTRRVIFFPALENYFRDDPCECTFFPESRYSSASDADLLSRAEDLQRTIVGGVGSENSLNIAEAHLAAFRQLDRDSQIIALKNWEREAFGKSVFCNCWYLGPDESVAMWRLYGRETGIAVESTPRLLDEAIKGFAKPSLCVGEFYPEVAAVRYDREVDDYYSNHPWLLKTKAFTHEKEIRVFAKVKTFRKQGVDILVDVSKLIRKVVLTPFAEQWELEALKACVEKLIAAYGFQFEVPVSVSSIRKSDLPRDPILEVLSQQQLIPPMSAVLFAR